MGIFLCGNSQTFKVVKPISGSRQGSIVEGVDALLPIFGQDWKVLGFNGSSEAPTGDLLESWANLGPLLTLLSSPFHLETETLLTQFSVIRKESELLEGSSSMVERSSSGSRHWGGGQ